MPMPERPRKRRLVRPGRIREQPRLSHHRAAHLTESKSRVGSLLKEHAKCPPIGSGDIVAPLSKDVGKVEGVALPAPRDWGKES